MESMWLKMTEKESELETELRKKNTSGSSRNSWNSFWDSYFQPQHFEKSGEIYKALGVKLFSKYWINGGSYWVAKGQSPMVKGRKKEDLESYIVKTRHLEGIHLAFLQVYSAITAICLVSETYTAAAISVGANVAVNLYPIMSMRYNRNRTIKLSKR